LHQLQLLHSSVWEGRGSRLTLVSSRREPGGCPSVGRAGIVMRKRDMAVTFLSAQKRQKAAFARSLLLVLAPRPGLEPGTCGLTAKFLSYLTDILARPHPSSIARIRQTCHVFSERSARTMVTADYTSQGAGCLSAGSGAIQTGDQAGGRAGSAANRLSTSVSHLYIPLPYRGLAKARRPGRTTCSNSRAYKLAHSEDRKYQLGDVHVTNYRRAQRCRRRVCSPWR
jgi:hypothetical protein